MEGIMNQKKNPIQAAVEPVVANAAPVVANAAPTYAVVVKQTLSSANSLEEYPIEDENTALADHAYSHIFFHVFQDTDESPWQLFSKKATDALASPCP